MFDKIQDYIQELSRQHRQTKYSIDKSYKLPLSDAFFCAEDIIRNRRFYQAIQRAVKLKKHKKKGFFDKITSRLNIKKRSDYIVCVDAGAGTGLLGLFALVCGCDKVIFIEYNPYTMSICKDIIKHFGYTEKAVFLNEDATNVKLGENWDILISETISTDFETEDFHKIINHLVKYKKENGVIIPSGFELIFESSDGKNIKKRFFCSLEGFKKESIFLKNVGKNIKMKMNISLYEDIEIKCGESMSLGNELEFGVESQEIVLFE